MPDRTVPFTVAPALAALLVKEGVAIGGLPEEQRHLALAWVWAGLPDGPLSERAVNELLRAQLQGPARCLGTDHVELRRWLVDAGWLARDGYGREYRRLAPDAAAPPGQALVQALLQALDGLDTAAFAQQCRAEHEARRAARRAAFEQRGAGPAPRLPGAV